MLHGTCSTGNGDSISSTAETESLDYLPDDVGFASTVFEPLQRDCGLLMQYQDMINRTALCLVRFREATREVELLRQENAGLRSLNRELSNHVINKQYEEYYFNTGPPQFDLASGLRKFCNLYEDDDGGDENDGGYGESPTSVMEETIGVDKDERVSLPKSISVRSSGYLKTSQSTSTAGVGKVTRHLTSNGPQRVYIRGRNKEEDEEPLELEVYNQGMFKTELCNKWQETGACPYGDNCQFAHGIKELRPVIRHPRYKTEVCRMILSGDICPYGHRCHFRHDVTDLASRSGRHVKPGAVKFSSEVK